MSYNSLLVQSCSIERKTTSLNDKAQMRQSWSVIYTNVPCRLDKIGNFTSTLSQTPTGQTSRNEFVGFFLPDQDIITGDRIKMDAKNDYAFFDNIYLYVTPSLDLYDAVKLHHKEIFLSIQET
jgi:hypothetical protein